MRTSTITLTFPLPGPRARWLAAGLAIGLLTAAISSAAFAPRPTLGADPSAPPEDTITVTGIGRIVVSPDIADLRLGVSATEPTVKAARAAAAEAMTRVLATLKKLGLADRDIQTTLLSLQPNYTYSNTKPPRLTGYTLSNGIAVTIRDLDTIGDAIDDALAAGATTLDGVTLRVDDPAKAEEQARTQAMSQARTKAQTLATGAGVTIVGVASISEVAAPAPYPIYFGAERAAALAEAATTPVEPGTNEVVVTVSVAYRIQ